MPNIPMPAKVNKPTAEATFKPAPVGLPADFSKDQAKKAVTALLAHHAKDKERQEGKTLISKDEHVWLVINTRRMPTKKSMKPSRIALPHPPLPPPPTTSVCLFSKDPQREYKDLLHAQNIKFISRVVGLAKLKGKHKPFEARRALCNDHQLFLCDESIMPMMPKLLGKIFFDAKKQPLPVNMKKKDLKAELAQAISSGLFHESLGTTSTFRIATALHHTQPQVLENLLASIPAVVGKIPDAWDNIKSIGIKTSGSTLLPIWTVDASKLYGQDEVDVKVKSKADKKRLRGEEESDDSLMTGSDDAAEKMDTGKAAKKAKKAPATAAAASSTVAAASPKKPVAVTNVKVATVPATKEPKKVLAGKIQKDAPASKKSAAGARTSVKASLIGKKKK